MFSSFLVKVLAPSMVLFCLMRRLEGLVPKKQPLSKLLNPYDDSSCLPLRGKCLPSHSSSTPGLTEQILKCL